MSSYGKGSEIPADNCVCCMECWWATDEQTCRNPKLFIKGMNRWPEISTVTPACPFNKQRPGKEVKDDAPTTKKRIVANWEKKYTKK